MKRKVIAVLLMTMLAATACGKEEIKPAESTEPIVEYTEPIAEESSVEEPEVESTVEPSYEQTQKNPEFDTPAFDDGYYEIHDIDEKTSYQGYITEEATALLEYIGANHPDAFNVFAAYMHRDEIMDNPWPGFELADYNDIDHVYEVAWGDGVKYYIVRDGEFVEVPSYAN